MLNEGKRTEVGKPLNFRGFVYSPINEQGVVYLFGLVAQDLNIIVESVQVGYPDCTAIKYVGKGRWERVRIEFEYKASSFFNHGHDPKGCDIIVCWENDLDDSKIKELKDTDVDIIELKTEIEELENPPIEDPETSSKQEYNLEYHFDRSNVREDIKKLYFRLDEIIKGVHPDIWDKYSKTMITYYSPEKMFLSVRFRQSSIVIDFFTNQSNLEGVNNIKNHENWGRTIIHNEQELERIVPSIRQSFQIMQQAEKEGIKTGWFALSDEDTDTEEDETGEE